MKIDRKGSTRIVLIFKNFVIKLPNFLDGYKLFLCGLLANLHEKQIYKLNHDNHLLAKVHYSNNFGFLLIMEKANEVILSHEEFQIILGKIVSGNRLEHFLMDDPKRENWGIVDGKIKKIDYGRAAKDN